MVQVISSLNINNQRPQTRPVAEFSVAQTMLPSNDRQYCLFNQDKIRFIVAQRESALPQLKSILQTSADNSDDEAQIIETLYIVDRLIDNGVKGIPAMYPLFAKFNNTDSANIQTFLAGIYRKTQVPDGFGPLISMLIKNNIKAVNSASGQEPKAPKFDPNEEIGGALLEYIRNYSQGPKVIDYSA